MGDGEGQGEYGTAPITLTWGGTLTNVLVALIRIP